MRALAAFVMQGRTQAVLAITALTVLSWIVSLASLLSMAAVALPTLRRGAFEGGVIVGAAALAVALFGVVLLGSPLQAAGYALALWLPTWLIAVLLRESGRLGLALAGTAVLACLMVGVLYLIYDDPAAAWMEELDRFFRPLLEQAPSAAEAQQFRQNLAAMSRYLAGLIAAGSMLTLVASLLIARWWQAMLFNPGGFRAEFLSLRLPVALAYGCLGLLAAAGLGAGGIAELAANLALPLFMLFLLAGFAVMHGVLAGKPNGSFWLAGMYVLLFFLMPLILMIILVGFSDTWADWRHRFAES